MNDDSHSNPGGSCQWESSSEDDVAKGSGELDVGSGSPDPLASFMG